MKKDGCDKMMVTGAF